MDTGRKHTGGKYHRRRKKRLHERRIQERHVVLGEIKLKKIRKRGGSIKQVLLKSNKVNVFNGKKTEKADIINVIETPQNNFLARQNRLVKGAIIETSIGKAKITNRPSQESVVNAVLLKE